MATVRMSQKLIDKMVSNAGQKFSKQNPEKDYPTTGGDNIISELGIMDKATLTKEFVEDTWLGKHLEMIQIRANYSSSTITNVEICSSVDTYDEDGNADENGSYDAGGNYISSYDKNKSYTLELSTPIEMPDCVNTGYSTISINVENTHPTFVACAEIDSHNSKVRNELYEFKNTLRETLGKFTTFLN